MRALYGLGNHNIFHVQRTLKESNKGLKLQTLGFDQKVKDGAEVVLVPTVSNFIRCRKALNESNAVVFVFDTPVLLEYLKPIELLDVKKLASYRYTFTPVSKEVLTAKIQVDGSIKVKQEAVDVIPRLLNASFPSIMKPILTFLYSIPNTEKRVFFRFQLLKYLTNPKVSLDDLKQTLIALSRQKGSYPALDSLLDFFATDQVKNTRKVLGEIRKAKKAGKTAKVDKLCEEYKVSSFDVKYISKAYSSDKKHFVVYKEEKTTDTVFAEYHSNKAAKKAVIKPGK